MVAGLYCSVVFSSRFLAYVGMASDPEPGFGSAGVPLMLSIISVDHRWSGALRMIPPVR